MAKIEVTEENINDLIGKWHESDSELELHEYVGFTWEQYARWVETGNLTKD